MQNYMQTINRSISQFQQNLLPQEVYETTIIEAKKIIRADAGSLFFHSGDTFQRIFSCVPKDKQGIPSPHGIAYKALRTGKPHFHTAASIALSHPELYQRGVKGIVVIPISYTGTLGVLTLQAYHQQKLRKNKLSELQLFGTVASIAIQKTRLISDLQEAIRSRDLFMSIASHEFKNPLTTIRMYTHMIEDAIEKNTIPSQKWTEILSTEITQLTELINDLLTKEKFSLYDMDYQWEVENVKKILQQTIEKYQTTHPDHLIEYIDETKENNISIRADSNKLQQVFNNILNNAVKFSSLNKAITTRLHTTNKFILIQITDQGDGIPAKDIKKLFEKFYKGNPRKEGMGLGLYVAKTIIDKHHGKVKVISKLGKGTTITIKFPRLQK